MASINLIQRVNGLLTRGNSFSRPALRSFTVSFRPHAPQDPLLEAFRKTTVFQQLQNKPEALLALQNFSEVLKNKGIDLSTPPSSMQMMKLVASSEFRQAAKSVVDEMQKAGIDFKSKELMNEIIALQKENQSGGKST